MLKQKKVVIIGGSSGIGFSTAKRSLEERAQVIIASRSLQKLENAKKRLGENVIIQQVDIHDTESINKFFLGIGAFDHLQLPGSEAQSGEFLSFSTDQAKLAFDSKFWGPYHVARYAASSINPEGSITFYSGRLSQRPALGGSIHSAINGAIEALARSLALELAPIRVNTISPGLTKTEFFDNYSPTDFNNLVNRVAEQLIIKRPACPEEIAAGAIYLMTSTYSTGTTLFVDGGFTFR